MGGVFEEVFAEIISISFVIGSERDGGILPGEFSTSLLGREFGKRLSFLKKKEWKKILTSRRSLQ